ncbi:MAG: ABC transporter ATP-binding protein [Methanotrichaceae archaeon]|nr:ABC transporter ATP-binding protein [Methanotrichaceae archaeon]
MLEIKDLVVSYNGTKILNGVNLNLLHGDSLAIIGESGAGKTTLGLAIMGFVEGAISGQICLDGRNLLALRREELRAIRGKDIAMVFQNVEDALNPLHNIHEQVREAMTVHQSGRQNGSKAEASARAYRLLEAVGLDREKAESFPHQLSGGERQRALIAMALANDPEVLILDEPTASLDSLTKGDILELLKAATAGKISMVITHDISTAARLSKMMAVLYAGKIVEMGQTEDLLKIPRHPYTRGLLRSYPDMTTTKDLQGIPGRMAHGIGGCPFHERCTQKLDICALREPALQKLDGRLIACHRGGIVPLLQLKGITKTFGQRKVLKDVSVTLHEGETLAVVGESGSGKTTLARIAIGLYDPDAGEVLLEEKRIGKRDLEFYRKVQMIYQNPKESLSHRMNVFDLVREPLDVQKLGSSEEWKSRVIKVLDEVELPADDHFLGRYPHQLSGGEAQRVAIARAMVLQPKLLIADEPTSALDASVQAKILRLLMDLQEQRGLSILFITHDIALARKVSDRIAVLHRGRIVEEGPTSEVIARPQHEYTRMLLEHASDLSERREEMRKTPIGSYA